MMKLTLKNIEGKGKVIFVNSAHVVSIQEAASGCLITTVRASYHVEQPADMVARLIQNGGE